MSVWPKLGGCCCFTMALAPLIAFTAVYWHLYNSAIEYNEDPLNALAANPDRTFDITPYDACGGDMNGNANFTTDWVMIYRYNAIMYTILLSFVVGSCLCLFVPPVMFGGICCFMCAGLPTIAAIIMTGIRRFSYEGNMCALSTDVVGEDLTFADDAGTLKAVFIAQCAMHVPTFICFMVGFQINLLGTIFE